VKHKKVYGGYVADKQEISDTHPRWGRTSGYVCFLQLLLL
jgi:hypothetical protein